MVRKGQKTNLCLAEYKLAMFVGRRRHEENIKRKAHDRAIKIDDPIGSNQNSMAAEIGMCKMWNVYPDLQCQGANKFDFKVWSENDNRFVTFDIKTVNNVHKNLLVTEWHIKKPCDWYVLVLADIKNHRTITCLGYAPKDMVFDPRNLRSDYKGYWVGTSKDLIDMPYIC